MVSADPAFWQGRAFSPSFRADRACQYAHGRSKKQTQPDVFQVPDVALRGWGTVAMSEGSLFGAVLEEPREDPLHESIYKGSEYHAREERDLVVGRFQRPGESNLTKRMV
jgi:hypothetical protein